MSEFCISVTVVQQDGRTFTEGVQGDMQHPLVQAESSLK